MIVFSEEPANNPLPAYNNSVVRFRLDNADPKICTMLISGLALPFETFPDADGNFYFNFLEIVSALINGNNFNDQISIDPPSKFLYQDPDLYYSLEAELTVEQTDGQTQSITKAWPFIKSVNQFDRKRFQNSAVSFLHPGESSVYNLSYFEGWPFDVSIYADQLRTLSILNRRTGQSTSVTLQKGVNRIFISNGENDNEGFENYLPLYTGINELEFKEGAVIHFTLMLDKKAPECGQLIKWFNQAGGWSYWLLKPLYIQEVKANTIERLNTDFGNLENSYGNFSPTGKNSEKAREYLTGLMTRDERNVFEEMISSPKLYYYNSELAQRFERQNFIEVEASGGSYKSGNKANKEEFKVRIEFPKYYTQKL